jgi:DNA-binding NtrC family response regulator
MIRETDENAQIIVMTAFGTIKDAVEAMKLGAFDYITKPFSLDEFKLIVKRALDVKALKDENIRLRKDLSECCGYPNIVGESHEMRKVFELLGRVSQTDSTVLILGESGTGKELIASTIHYQGLRKDKSFIKVNCAALPENLIESELFGYEKGAFTGATRRKPGRFELADKGTLFLDEIGDLPHSTQIKLLRVLQDGYFERLGGTETINVDVRVITATNRNLEEDVKKGSFREDLYYRLNVIPLLLPPLRKRIDDIPLLIDNFNLRYNSRLGKRVKFSTQAIKALMAYDFPGNVRELENLVERCIALSEGETINMEDLPSHIVRKRKDLSPGITLSEISAEAEKEYITRILRSTKGNRTKAAEILSISRKTLWEKMNNYGIES